MAKAKSARVTLLSHSLPGEFPRKQTGDLRRRITYEVDADLLIARVGTNLIYGKFLELGTKKMRPRPFLRRTAASEQVAIAGLLAG